MASNSIFDYVANVAKSVKFATIKSVKDTMPVTSSMIDQNKETVKELYKNIVGSKSTIPRLNAVQDNVIFRQTNKMFNNIKADLASGNFYHPEREDMMANMSALSGLLSGLGGMGDDFAAELNALFSGDFGDLDNGENPDGSIDPTQTGIKSITKGDALVASALFRSQSTSTNCIGKLMSRLHDHGTKTQRAISNLQFAQSERSIRVNQAGFNTMTAGFNRLIDFNNQVMRVHVENSQKFYEDVTNTIHESNAILKSLHAIQKKVYEGQFKKTNDDTSEDPTKGADVINFNELFKNGFNIAAYRKMVKQNVQKSPTGMLYQITTMLPLLMQNMVNNPLGTITESVIHGMMGGSMELAMKKLDDTISGAFSTALARLYDYGKKSSSGMLGNFARMFGFKQERKSLAAIDTSKYYKEAMSWNGIAQKALVDVIPSYLARIEAAATGNGERYFDFHGSGKWQSSKEIKNKVRDLDRTTAKQGTQDVNSYVESVIRQMRFDKNERMNRAQQRMMRKNWERIQEGITKHGTIDFKHMIDSPESYGTTPEMIQVFSTVLRSLGQTHPGKLMKATNSIAAANQQYNASLDNMSVTSGGSLVPLLTGGLNGEVLKKKGFNPNNLGVSPVLNDLTQLKDNRGNTLYDYQYAILRELINIQDHGGFGGGSSRRKSNKRGNAPSVRDINDVLNETKSSSEYEDDSAPTQTTGRKRSLKRTIKLSRNAQKKTSAGKYNSPVNYKDVNTDIGEILDPESKIGKLMLANAIGKVQGNYDRATLAANSGFFSFLSMDQRDPSKYHKLPDGIDESMPLTEQLLKAANIGQKFDVIRHNIDALTDAPSAVFTSIIGKADQAVYDLLFGRPTGEVDPITGKPINGIFDKIMSEVNKNFGDMNSHINDMINKAKSLFGDGGPLSFLKDKLKDLGFDIDQMINNNKAKMRRAGSRGLNTAGAVARQHAQDVADSFMGTFRDLGIINSSGKFDFSAFNPFSNSDETPNAAKGMPIFGGNKNWAILSKGEAVIPPQKNTFAQRLGLTGYGMGTDYVKSSGLYPLAPGSRVINAKENIFNPNRDTADLNRDERNENSIRQAMKHGSYQFADFIPGFAKGTKTVGGKANDILRKLNKQGTDLTPEDINMLMNANSYYDRLGVVHKILEKHINEGLFDNDKNDSRKKKMIYQLENLMKSLNYTKTTKQNFYMNAMGVKKDDQGNMVLGDKADRNKLTQMLDLNNLEKKSYLELRDIREALDAMGEEQIASDKEIAEGKFAKKEGPLTGFRQFGLAAFGADPKKGAELSAEYIKKNSKSLASGGIGGAILSTIFPLGGPFMGAMLGMTMNTLKNSESFNSFMFGKAIGKDKKGNTIRDESGLLPSAVPKIFNKYFPDIKKYGTVGTIAGLVTPFGPLGGAMLGASAAIIKNNSTLNRMLFGGGKDGQRGLLGKDALQKLKKKFPHIAVGALSTMLFGGFGILGNAVIGSGLGFLSTTEMFKKFMLGPKDKDGIRRGGLAGTIRRHVIDPLKETMDDFKSEFRGWFRKKIFDPMAEGLRPIGKVMAGSVSALGEFAQKKIASMFAGNNSTLAKFLGNRFNEFFKDVHEHGGIGAALAHKFTSKTAEKVADWTKRFGHKVEDFGYKSGLINDDAQGTAKYYERKGIDNARSKSIGRMAEMKDKEFDAANELLQMIQGVQSGAIDDDVKRLQTRQAELFTTEMEKMADAYGSDSREKAAISDFARKFDSYKDFAKLDHITGENELRKTLFRNTNISEENKDRIMKEFLARRKRMNSLQANKEAIKDPEKNKEYIQKVMDSFGYTGSMDDFLNQDMDFIAKVGRAEQDARNLAAHERSMGITDEETPAEKQQKSMEENSKTSDRNTAALEETTSALRDLINVLTANDPFDKGYKRETGLSKYQNARNIRMNKLVDMATDPNRSPEQRQKYRDSLKKNGVKLTEQDLEEMTATRNTLDATNRSIKRHHEKAKKKGKIAGKEPSTAEKIKNSKSIGGAIIEAGKAAGKGAADFTYHVAVERPANMIEEVANAYKNKHTDDREATDNINNISKVIDPITGNNHAEDIKDYEEARKEEEEIKAKRNKKDDIENHAFGDILSGMKTGMQNMGKAMWNAGKESFKQQAKGAWGNIKNRTKEALFGSPSGSSQVNGVSAHGIPVAGAAAALTNAGGSAGGISTTTDAKGNPIKEVTTSEGDIMTYGPGGADGSWNKLNTKDNAAAEAKLAKKNETQERIAGALEGIANKLGAPVMGEKEGEKKGIFDSILDLLKAPLSFLGGAFGAAGTMISGWLAKHLWQPLKNSVRKFAGNVLKGIGKIGTGALNGLKKILFKFKPLALLLGAGGYFGKKLYNMFSDDDEDKVEGIAGFNGVQNGLGGLSPEEQKLAQTALEKGQSQSDITNMIKVHRQEKDKETTTENTSDIGYGAGGILGSILGSKLGHAHIGSGLGGAIGGAIANYARTGEIDAGSMAVDAGQGYLTSKIIGKLFDGRTISNPFNNGPTSTGAGGPKPVNKFKLTGDQVKKLLTIANDPNHPMNAWAKRMLTERAGITKIITDPKTGKILTGATKMETLKNVAKFGASQLGEFGGKVTGYADELAQKASSLWADTKERALNTGSKLAEKASYAWESAKTGAQNLGNKVTNALKTGSEYAGKAASMIEEKIPLIIDKMKAAGDSFLKGIGKVLPEAVEGIKAFLGKIFAKLCDPNIIKTVAPSIVKRGLLAVTTGGIGLAVFQGVFAIKGYFDGKTREATAKFFNVSEDKVTQPMQTLSGIARGFINFIPFLDLILPLVGGEEYVKNVVVAAVGPIVGFTVQDMNKLSGSSEEETDTEKLNETKPEQKSFFEKAKDVVKSAWNHTPQGRFTNYFKDMESKKHSEELGVVLEGKIADALNDIKASIGRFLPTNVKDGFTDLANSIIAEATKINNINKGMDVLKRLQSSNSNVENEIPSTIMNFTVDKSQAVNAYVKGTLQTENTLNIPVEAANKEMKMISGIIQSITIAIPFLTGFVDEKTLVGLILDKMGSYMGLSKADIEKAKDTYLKAQKSNNRVSNYLAQANKEVAQGKNKSTAHANLNANRVTSTDPSKQRPDTPGPTESDKSKSTWQVIKDTASSAWEGVKSTASNVWNKAKDFGSRAWNAAFGSGKGLDSTSFDPWSQLNPAYAGVGFNTSMDTHRQSARDSWCGPLAASFGMHKLGLGGDNPFEAANYVLSHNGKEKDGGTYPSALQNYARSKGADTFKVSNQKQAQDVINDGGVLLTMGKESNVDKTGEGRTTPYGQNPHWVTVSKDGVHDSESSGRGRSYNVKDILNHSTEMIGMKRGKKSGMSKAKSAYNSLKGKAKNALSKFGRSKYGRGRSTPEMTSEIWAYLKSKGLSNVAAAGILGNFQAESAMYSDRLQSHDPSNGSMDVPVDGVTGYGLAQWTYHSRQQALKDYAQSVGQPAGDWKTQIDFMLSGKDGDLSQLIQAMDASGDPSKAALLFHDQYERSADDDEKKQRRGDYAQQFFKSEGKGIVDGASNVSSGGTSSGSSPTSKIGGFFGMLAKLANAFTSIFNGTSDNGSSGSNTPGSGTQTTGGITGDGNTMHIDAQTGGNCTIEATRAMVKAYTDRDEPKRNEQFSWWNPTLENDLNGEWNFFGNSDEERAKFESFISNHFAKKPGNPLFLYQTGGDGRDGNHPINKGQGDHATVIGRKLANGKYEHYDSAGGVVKEFNLSDIFDPSARGNPRQGMEVGQGNSIVEPHMDPSRPIANWQGSTPTAQQGQGKFANTGLGKLLAQFGMSKYGRDKSTQEETPQSTTTTNETTNTPNTTTTTQPQTTTDQSNNTTSSNTPASNVLSSTNTGGLFNQFSGIMTKLTAPVKAGWEKFKGALSKAFANNPAIKKISELMFGGNPFDTLLGIGGGSSGGAGASASYYGGPINATEAGKKVVAEARSHIGKPYVMGANGPEAYDCSSHAQTSYAAAGLEVPRTADVQHDFFKEKGALVPVEKAQPGDMIFFSNTYCPGVSHVGIVTKPGDINTIEICHASSSRGVIECKMSEWHIEHLTKDEGLPIGSLALAFPGSDKPTAPPPGEKFTKEEREANTKLIDETGISYNTTSSGGPSQSYLPANPDDEGLYDDIDTENPQITGNGKRGLLSKFGMSKDPFSEGLTDYSFSSDIEATKNMKPDKKLAGFNVSNPFSITSSEAKAARFGMGFSSDPKSADYWVNKGYSLKEAQQMALKYLNGQINTPSSIDKYKTDEAKAQTTTPTSTPSNSIADMRRQEEEKKRANNVSLADMRRDEEKRFIAPNGLRITDNDINYLKNNGYTEDQALETLKKTKRYTEPVKNKEEKTKYTAPNGLRYSQNDIDYLTKNGYSEEQAIALLKKEKKYTEPVTEEEIKKSWSNANKLELKTNKNAKHSGDPKDIKTWLAQGYGMEEAMEKASEASSGKSSNGAPLRLKNTEQTKANAKHAAELSDKLNDRYTDQVQEEKAQQQQEAEKQEAQQNQITKVSGTVQQQEVSAGSQIGSELLAAQTQTNQLLTQILAAIQGAVELVSKREIPTLNPNTGTKETQTGSTVKAILTALGGGSNLGIGDKFMMNATRNGNNQGDINNILNSMNAIARR